MLNEVVVLCGGYGTRLGKLTQNIPKPLVKVGDKPIMEHTVCLIIDELFPKKFLLVVGHKSEQIKQYFGNGSKIGAKINYIKQNLPSKKEKSKLHLLKWEPY